MAVSRGRLIGIRIVLGVAIILFLFLGVMLLFFPQQFLSMAAVQEKMTTILKAIFGWAGALNITWVIAMAIAFKDVLGSRRLIQAIIPMLLITGVLGFYYDAFVVKSGATAVSTDVLYIILGVLLWVLYPWKQKVN